MTCSNPQNRTATPATHTSVEPPEFFKVLLADGSAPMGTGRWTVGERLTVEGPLVPCQNGLHVVRLEHLLDFLSYGPAIHPVIDASTERIEDTDKVVLRYATVGPRYAAWSGAAYAHFAADCAERVLHLFESQFPNDDRPRRAIEAARSGNTRAAGGAAARAAARAAGGAAARAAARAAAMAAEAAMAAARAAEAAERQWQTERLWQYLLGDAE